MGNIRHILVMILCAIAVNAYGFGVKNVCNDNVDMSSEFDGHVNIGLGSEASSAPIYYHDTKSHIVYEINKQTKEAIVGQGYAEEHNAFAYPPIGSNENWNSFWVNIEIPSTITYENEIYTVTSVAPYAFHKATVIQTVKLPETIESIGSNAFSWCTSLKEINIPSQITEIAGSTFYLCHQLKKIVLPKTVKKIKASAFRECWSLKSINIPGNCTEIGDEAFSWCTSLSNIILEDGAEPLKCGYSYALSINYQGTIDKPSFRGVFADAPADTLYIGRDSFICPTTKGRLLRPFLSISNYGNASTSSYRTYTGKMYDVVKFGDCVTVIPDSMFWASSIDADVQLPANLKVIGNDCFYSQWGCFSQECLVIPDSVISIGNSAFENCIIEQLNILGPCDTWGTSPFNKCKIQKLLIGEKVRHINGFASNNINYVKCLPSTPPASKNLFGIVPIIVSNGAGTAYRKQWEGAIIVDYADETVTVNVKTPGSLYSRLLAQDYQLETVYKLKLKGELNEDDLNVLSSMTKIHSYDLSELNIDELPSGFFQGMNRLFHIDLPKNLKRINDNEFKDCTRLESAVTIPSSCTIIGKSAFENTGIQYLTSLGSVDIEYKAFSQCTKLNGIDFKGSVVVHDSVFYLSEIDSVAIPTGSILHSNAFGGSNLKKITFADGVDSIGENSLGENVRSIKFDGMVNSINKQSYTKLNEIFVSDVSTWCALPFPDNEIMKGAPLLYINGELPENIVLPEGLEIRDYAFYNCRTLKSVFLPNGSIKVPVGLFKDCTNLSSVNIPETVVGIGDEAFWGCCSLKSLSLPASVEKIGIGAFYNCNQLSYFQIPEYLEEICDKTFYGCSSLKSVELPTSLLTIGNQAFCDCDSLEKIKLPLSITSIAPFAFYNCDRLSEVRAQWQDPFEIDGSAFDRVASDCYLYVPIMTASKYLAAGWDFPNLKEAGTLSVETKGGGEVVYNENVVRNGFEELLFSPYKSFYLTISPDEGHSIRKVKLNGEDIMFLIEDGKIFIEEPEENFELSVVFADNSIVNGDVNGDKKLNSDDVIFLMRYIVRDELDIFYDYASDMNDDGIVNVTDVIILIDNILE